MKSWELKTLADVGDIVAGGTPSTTEASYWNGKIPWITPADLSGYNNKFIEKGAKSITDLGLKESSAKLMPPGSILFSSRAPIGYVVIAKNHVSTNQGFKSVVPNKKIINSEYLYYYLKFAKHLADELASGTTFKEISGKNFAKIKIPVPSLKVQADLISKIDNLFAKIDSGTASLESAMFRIDDYKQSVLDEAFRGRLTRKVVGDKLPSGWSRKNIGDICKVVRGGSPRPAGDPKFYNGKIPFLKVADLTKDDGIYLSTYEYTIKEAGLQKTRQIKPDTLLLTNSGATLGVPKICTIDATMNDGVAAFLDLDKRSNLYLYFFWKSKTRELRTINQGAAQPNLNTEIIRNYELPYCSFEEQAQVVKKIQLALKDVIEIETEFENKLNSIRHLKQSVLKSAFEGKLI